MNERNSDAQIVDCLRVFIPMGLGFGVLFTIMIAIFHPGDQTFWEWSRTVTFSCVMGVVCGWLLSAIMHSVLAFPVLFFGRDWFNSFPNWAARRATGSFLDDVKRSRSSGDLKMARSLNSSTS